MPRETIQMSLFDYFLESDQFTLSEATHLVNEVRDLGVNAESIRARIYEGIDAGLFTRVARGVYRVESQLPDGARTTCLLVNGNGRDLSAIPDASIDGIVTDHPYDMGSALDGGNRRFAEYERFRYEARDMAEKERVLKPGAFCVEFLPEESAQNWRYLATVKELAEKVGLTYFAKVPWVKGSFVSNTGRKAHNTEDVVIFSKGQPRSLRPDNKRNLATAREGGVDVSGMDSAGVAAALKEAGLPVAYMRGTAGMLPASFVHQPPSRSERVHAAEKPVELLEEIVGYITLPYETVLDQFAGSGNLAVAAANTNRNAIVIESDPETFEAMKRNVESRLSAEAVEVRVTGDDAFVSVANERTSLGAPRWVVGLPYGRTLEVTREEEGPAGSGQVYGCAVLCSDAEESTGLWRETMGVVSWTDFDGFDREGIMCWATEANEVSRDVALAASRAPQLGI